MPERPRPLIPGISSGEGISQDFPASQADYDENVRWSRLARGETIDSVTQVGCRAKAQFGDALDIAVEEFDCFERGKFWRLSGGPIILPFPHPLLPR